MNRKTKKAIQTNEIAFFENHIKYYYWIINRLDTGSLFLNIKVIT